MKVFLSWSGDLSHRIACEFRDWLPCVLQYAKPYVSSQDIDKGARWTTDIAKELHESAYGILCITRENIEAPWINFEAGALSKTLDKSYVSPFLFDIKRSEVQGPLLQFQSTIFEKEDVRKLVGSINNHSSESEKLGANGLVKAFDVWWPQLSAALEKLQKTPTDTGAKKPPALRQEAVLEEILELVRTQQKILRSPDLLLPPDYIDYALSRSEQFGSMDAERADVLQFLHSEIQELSSAVHDFKDKEVVEKLGSRIDRLHDMFHKVLDPTRRPRKLRRPAVTADVKASTT